MLPRPGHFDEAPAPKPVESLLRDGYDVRMRLTDRVMRPLASPGGEGFVTTSPLGTRETRLLIALVQASSRSRSAAESAQLAAARAFGDRPLEWDTFVEAARYHRLGALVLEGARELGLFLPASVQESLAGDRARELARTAIQLHELDVIAELAASTRRPIILLKGAWMATALYPDPTMRPTADLGLLVDARSMNAWSTSLRGLGYELRGVADHATLFADRARGVYVELHHALTPCAAFLGVETRELADRSVPVPAYHDPAVRTLCLSDHLLHLTLHAAFQQGMRQAAIDAWDVHLLARRDDLDLPAFLARVDRRPLRAFIYGGLCLAERLFPHARISRARQTLEAALPGHLKKRAERLRPERLLSPSYASFSGTPLRRLAWVESPVESWSLAREILRPKDAQGPRAYLSRASQLLRNHVVAPIRTANHPPTALLSSPTKASLDEVGHV